MSNWVTSGAALEPPQVLHEPSREQLLEEIEDLRAALETRDIIGQAKGIIRLLAATDDDRAFTLLCQISQDTNRPVRELAVVIAERAGIGQLLPADVMTSWQRRTDSTTQTSAASPPL
ncbi:hypothetical protein GCM10022223_18080 [Kineosporia mesophila]|uniref:ANTAR domain-containing protein n=1 Tax=Kineosporia mesophila TaxID=566012 RepID=A0ABP6ZBQ7_9ACTN|nr:ANTAR domain-containing protein [Kineosporia mesophila]MCD5351955.1 ANTAR domain-containing protein [Kineosporia mesophila]